MRTRLFAHRPRALAATAGKGGLACARHAAVAPLLLAVLVGACRPESAPLAPAAPGPNQVTAPAEAMAPSAAADPHAGLMLPQGTAGAVHDSPAVSEPVSGVVKEVVPAGRYVYLRLERTVAGQVTEEWAAVLQTEVAVGDAVTIKTPFQKRDFDSPTLKRRFDTIWFGTLGTGNKGTPTASARPNTLIPPPEGGFTIAEVHTKAAELAGKTVTVRGMVTKYNDAILGRNWLHVSDGSAEGRDDLAVTTDGAAAVGDVVTVTGTVAINQDFGAGYTYDLLVEKATLTPEPGAAPTPQ